MEERKNAIIEQIIEVLRNQTGIELSPEAVEELMGDIQREQLKGLVYQAFLAIQRGQEGSAEGGETPLETK
jgi:hypothetical protein